MHGATGRSVYNIRVCQRWKSHRDERIGGQTGGTCLGFLRKRSCGLKVCLKYNGHLANVLHASACNCTVFEYAGGCLSSFQRGRSLCALLKQVLRCHLHVFGV